eukprot:tig00020555_g10970.t1
MGYGVFVSPTKALVNQVAAEVYARFRGKTYTEGGKSVFGMKLRDYGYYDFDCQVLVTVPAVLEGLLLSPHETIQAWVRRIKFVIFDEVHCIGQSATANREAGTAESGNRRPPALDGRHPGPPPPPPSASPRSALSYTPLPSLALAAQAKSQRNVKLVQFNIRYSDSASPPHPPRPPRSARSARAARLTRPLAAQIRLPAAGHNRSSSSPAETKAREMRVLHPCAAMSVARLLRAGGFPQDLSFAPDESTALYDALVRAAKTPGLLEAKAAEAEGAALAALDPDAYFAQDRVITKARAKSFETDLKALVSRWLAAGEGHRRALQVALDAIVGDATAGPWRRGGGDRPWLAAHYLGLLRTLRENDKLPVITFCFDRKVGSTRLSPLPPLPLERGRQICEVLALETGPCWSREEWRRTNTEEGRRKVRPAGRRPGEEEAGGLRRGRGRCGTGSEEGAREAARKAMEKASQKMKGREMEEMAQEGALESLAEEVEETQRGMTDSEYGPLVRLLRRGIGVHHAGLNKKYARRWRSSSGASTSRSSSPPAPRPRDQHAVPHVVFAGDSVFLNALQYRQSPAAPAAAASTTSGTWSLRAAPPQAQPPPHRRHARLRGHYPLSTSLVLRSLCLYTQSCMQPVGRPPLPGPPCSACQGADERRERTGEKVLSLLGQPLFCHGGDSLGAQVYHRVRYALEYLRRSRYIDRDASLDGLSVRPLAPPALPPRAPERRGRAGGRPEGSARLSAPAAAQGRPNVAEAARRLVLVLSHLFGVIRTPRSVLRRTAEERLHRHPPRPPEASPSLPRWRRCWTGTTRRPCGSRPAPSAPSSAPRLQARLRGGAEAAALGGDEPRVDGLGRHGAPAPAPPSSPATTPPPHPLLARSPFSAIAGKATASTPSRTSSARCGRGRDLEAGNRLEAGDVWFVLNDFKLVLKTLSASLAKLLAEEEEDALAEVVAAALADFHDKLKTLELDRRY